MLVTGKGQVTIPKHIRVAAGVAPGSEVTFSAGGEVVKTGLKKFGAVLGDDCKTGCNTVLNPGVVMGPGSVTYTNASLRGGYYPAGTLVKVRQEQKFVEMDRLRRE